jgi:leucyl aminopeptidase
VETPANFCTPQYLAETAGRIAALAPERFQLEVLERPAVEELGMGLYLGVALVSRRVGPACNAHNCGAAAI